MVYKPKVQQVQVNNGQVRSSPPSSKTEKSEETEQEQKSNEDKSDVLDIKNIVISVTAPASV